MLPEPGPPATNTVAGASPSPRGSLQTEDAAPPRCTNCGSSVPGRYCGECGQRLQHSVHSVWHFAREATEDLTHADSRVWRTFAALLVKPGYLTREFLDGRRARYLPPLRLYLVLSVVFFLIAAAGSSHSRALVPTNAADAKQTYASSCHSDYAGPWNEQVQKFVETACAKVKQDQGRSVSEAFLHALPRAMFLFLPILALVMMGMYWRPRRYYVEHLLFFVHNHAFAFLLITLCWVASLVLPESIDGIPAFLACLYIPYYVFASMRRVYGQRRWLTLIKLTVLSFAYLFFSVLMLLLISVYSVLTV